MSQAHYKFNRPAIHLVAGIGNEMPALIFSGSFPDGEVEEAYSGYVSVLNAIGAFTVTVTSGSLPPGATVATDNVAGRVIISWPAYTVDAAPIANPGFENLFEGWDPGPGWRPSSLNPIAGAISAGFIDQGGESVISSLSRYLAAPNTPIHAKCLVRQGASAAGAAGAAVRLEYRDPTTGDVIGFKDGNAVMSASDNAVFPSDVNAVTPNQPVLVNVAGKGIRIRENKEVWIDSFEWNHTVPASGVLTPFVYSFNLRVRDSAGRIVDGAFTIDVKDTGPTPAFVNIGTLSTFGSAAWFAANGIRYWDGIASIGGNWWSATEGNPAVPVPGIGGDYEIRFTLITGPFDANPTYAAFDVWLPLTVSRYIRPTSSGARAKVEIRDATTLVIKDTGYVQYN